MQRSLISLPLVAVLLASIPSARAQEAAKEGCGSGPSIVLKASRGSLVACDALYQLDPNRRLSTHVAVDFAAGETDGIAERLSELYGAPVEIDFDADVPFTGMQLEGAPIYAVLDRLTEFGRVKVRGLDYAVVKAIREELDGAGISGSFEGVRLDDALATLSVIVGRQIVARDLGDTMITMSFDRTPLKSLLRELAHQAGTHITIRKPSDTPAVAT